MNTQRLVPHADPVQTAARPRPPVRGTHRDRDFGIGYGNSSGYGQDRRYAEGRTRSMFRCS